MTRTKILLRPLATVIALATALAATALADPCKVGQKVDPFHAGDQHGKGFDFDPSSTRFLLVSFDMDRGKAANRALEQLGADYLPGKNAVFLSNIHGMPGIGRTFALPKMRKYPHRIILGDDAALIARFPSQAAKVTILKLAGGRVVSILYWDPASEALDPLLK